MSLVNKDINVGFIGVGIMGEALLSGLIKSGFDKSNIYISEKRAERAEEVSNRFGVKAVTLDSLCERSDYILLVTKPQDFDHLLSDISGKIKAGALLISFAAGKKISKIASACPDSKVIRVMPNTPVLVGKGMSVISADTKVSQEELNFVVDFLNSCGKAIVVTEDLQDAVTATSGSGPAYFFAFVEEMIKGAAKLGLSDADATTLTIQTINGAAAMLEESGKSPTTLRENVTSPNGTTAAALQKFNEGGFGELIATAMKAARDRSQELA